MRTTIKDLILQDYKGKFRIVCLEHDDIWKSKEHFFKEDIFKLREDPMDGSCVSASDCEQDYKAPFGFLYGGIVETIEETPTLKDGMFITFNYDDIVRVGVVLRDNSNNSLYVSSISKEYIESFDIDIFDEIEWKEIKL